MTLFYFRAQNFVFFSYSWLENLQLNIIIIKMLSDQCLVKIYKLHYHNVEVLTDLKKSSEFTSDFCIPNSSDSKRTSNQILVYAGYLKAIDPITKSIILTAIDEASNRVLKNILILGQHVVSVHEVETNVPVTKVKYILEQDSQEKVKSHPFYQRETEIDLLSPDQLKSRQEEILNWLKLNRIPTVLDELSNDLIIADSVKIRPPYQHVSDYICPTQVVLKRIKHIIDQRPKEIAEKSGNRLK